MKTSNTRQPGNSKEKCPVLDSKNLCEIEIFCRNKVKIVQRPRISGSQDTVNYLRSVWSEHMDRIEEFMVLVMNRANRVLGWARVSSGGISGTVADPKLIFQVALKANASSLILAHNHPSGNLTPSESDVALTKKMQEAGKHLDLPVLDHLILTSEGYYTFVDEGLL